MSTSASPAGVLAPRLFLFQFAVFLSAFLLFSIQPMVAKALLPSFGGSYLVWGSCLVFFQGFVLLGYYYAHAIQRRFGIVRYARWHLFLLLAVWLFLPVPVSLLSDMRPTGPLFLEVIAALFLTMALPFFTIATGSVILQAWLSRSELPERRDPYVLFAASNLGSLLALLSYPIVIEPFLTLRQQSIGWAVLFAVMMVSFVACLPPRRKDAPEAPHRPAAPARKPLMATWFLLSMAGSMLLLSVTNTITFDIASVPFLWILPLSIYLLTFVLVFKRVPWAPRWLNDAFCYAAIAGVAMFLLSVLRWTMALPAALLLHNVVLFFVCMAVHGAMARLRPADLGLLTTYYVAMSAGGFAGSVLVGGLVPLISSNIVEYPLALAVAALTLELARRQGDEAAPGLSQRLHVVWAGACAVAVLIGVPLVLRLVPESVGFAKLAPVLILGPLAFVLLARPRQPAALAAAVAAVVVCVNMMEMLVVGAGSMIRHRNYYGIYKVYEVGGSRLLQHGTTLHGRQYLDPEREFVTSGYYHETSPIYQLLTDSHIDDKQSIAMVGLGMGALATLFREGQDLHIYELDPDNLPIADAHFSFLRHARDKGVNMTFTFGDGRIALRDVPDATYDMIIMDAFSSGAIPIHLLTVEAVREYFRALKPDGLLVFHISNRLVNLEPVLGRLARAEGLHALAQSNSNYIHPDATYTVWMVMTRDGERHHHLMRTGWRWPLPSKRSNVWSDEFSNLLLELR